MAIASTKTQIANLTASLLKKEAVSSIEAPESGNKFAQLAARWYDEARREVLADHIWNFALKRAQLAAHTDTPPFKYGVQYELPSDYIRVATIGDEDDPETDYKIEDGFILCHLAAPLNFRYIFDQEDVTKFSPKFKQCLARKLAAYMAYDMTGNRSMVEQMEQAYLECLSTGATLDGQESPPTHKIRRSRWKAAKEGRGVIGRDYQGRVVV